VTDSCTRNRVRVQEWIDGRLSEPRRDEVKRHLADCPPCLRQARETAALVRTLRSLPRDKAPGGVLEGVVSRLAAGKIQAQRIPGQKIPGQKIPGQRSPGQRSPGLEGRPSRSRPTRQASTRPASTRPAPARLAPARLAFVSPRVSFWAACTAAFLLGVTGTVVFNSTFTATSTGRLGPAASRPGVAPDRDSLPGLETRSAPTTSSLPGGEPWLGPFLENPGSNDLSLVAHPGDPLEPESETRPRTPGSSALEKLPGPATGR